ncbi:MAG TPA: hypothetical protein VFG60_08535 [Burkholderiaceae bacterium]|nr:hypothetical protein [Burkholderiaceae bacterium]
MTSMLTQEIATAAARLVVEDGMEYGPAKRRAARLLGGTRSNELPGNDKIEDEVRTYLRLFCADTQPTELAALRSVALAWMERLAEFRPHVTGAVWRGTATRLNDVHLDLFCDDPKSAEIALIDRRIPFETGSSPRGGEAVSVLSLSEFSPALGEHIGVHLSVLDHDDLRGALKPDASGHSWRGDASALRKLIEPEA